MDGNARQIMGVCLFSNMPDELTGRILNDVNDFESLKQCERVSRLWRAIIDTAEYRASKEEYFAKMIMPKIDLFPPGIVDAIGGKKRLCQLPILDLSQSDYRGQKYIDCLTPEDLKGNDIWRGEDSSGRPFVTFAFHSIIFKSDRVIFGNGVRTIHKVSADSLDSAWTGAGNKTLDFDYGYHYGNGVSGIETEERLKELIRIGHSISFSFSGLNNNSKAAFTKLGVSSSLPLAYDMLNNTNYSQAVCFLFGVFNERLKFIEVDSADFPKGVGSKGDMK